MSGAAIPNHDAWSPSPSKSPLRATTPSPHSPSRLVIAPALRPTHSLSNLHVHMSSLTPGGTTSHIGGGSSASSVINVDMSEGILVPEADAEVGLVDEAGNAYVTASTPIGDEASKKALRDHLRKTLNKKDSYIGACHPWLRYSLLKNPRYGRRFASQSEKKGVYRHG
jgi:hypothetical protein